MQQGEMPQGVCRETMASIYGSDTLAAVKFNKLPFLPRCEYAETTHADSEGRVPSTECETSFPAAPQQVL